MVIIDAGVLSVVLSLVLLCCLAAYVYSDLRVPPTLFLQQHRHALSLTFISRSHISIKFTSSRMQFARFASKLGHLKNHYHRRNLLGVGKVA